MNHKLFWSQNKIITALFVSFLVTLLTQAYVYWQNQRNLEMLSNVGVFSGRFTPDFWFTTLSIWQGQFLGLFLFTLIMYFQNRKNLQTDENEKMINKRLLNIEEKVNKIGKIAGIE